MPSTPIAASSDADPPFEHLLEDLQKRLELMRTDSVLQELEACRSRNERLIAWFRGRRLVLARELGL